MNARLKFAAATLCAMLLGIPAAQSDDYFASTDLYVELGTAEGDFAAFPGNLKVEVGEIYRLILRNPSPLTHVAMAPEFGGTVVTTGIRRLPQGVPHMTGTIAGGIEVRSGETTELYFVPFKQGRYKLFCEDRMHTAAGMEITIEVAE